jgi:asparagine synthase (glutamine-hydrolysing)
MCGIAGLFDLRGAVPDLALVRAMCALIEHRGPDDEGFLARPAVALGHKRLAIIDLSPRGRNPVENEDGRFVLVANGEIYNHEELRRELVANGHTFRSDTDTEVILHLFEDEGEAGVEKLNGMFAFAIWDAADETLTLARDRFGVKPLYYARIGDQIAFASEVKAFLALPGFEARIDPCGLAEHFAFQNTFGERTLFAGVSLLPAGEMISFRRDGHRKRRYWDLRFEPSSGIPIDEWSSGILERFEASVKRQLMSDVPLGSYLSGGMDTGSIAAVASRSNPGMHTFTCGFRLPSRHSELEAFFDERPESHRLAAGFGTIHHELVLGADAMAPAFPAVVWHLDEPRVGINYPVYYTAAMIGRHVTVVLSGVGGDELFAGYPWRYAPLLAAAPDQYEDCLYRGASRLLAPERASRLFTESFRRELGDFSTRDSVREVLTRSNHHGDRLHEALYFDFKTFLNGLLLVDDKLSMAHSVEARVPFLDNDFVDYVRRIPSELRMEGDLGKIVLRRAMQQLLPDEVVERRKQGFTPPDRTWYKGESLPYVRDLILGPRALDRGYFEPAFVEEILAEHLADRVDHRFLLWSLMCFEWWNRLYVDREYPPARPSLATMEKTSSYARSVQ